MKFSKLRYVLTLIVPILLIRCAVAAPVSSKPLSKKQTVYLSLGTNIQQSLTNNTATISYTQLPNGTLPTTSTHKSPANALGFGLQIGAGYRWRLSPTWAWSLGGRLSHTSLSENGTDTTTVLNTSAKFPTEYDVLSTTLKSVARLFYQTHKIEYYAELTLGLASLTSNYQSAVSFYHSRTVTNVVHGLGLGLQYSIFPNTTIDGEISYENLGKAKLGSRQNVYNAKGDIAISQSLQTLNYSMRIVHWM